MVIIHTLLVIEDILANFLAPQEHLFLLSTCKFLSHARDSAIGKLKFEIPSRVTLPQFQDTLARILPLIRNITCACMWQNGSDITLGEMLPLLSPRLKALEVENLYDFSLLSSFVDLERLSLWDTERGSICSNAQSLRQLQHLTSVSFVKIPWEWDWIAHLKSLREFSSTLSPITSIAPVSQFPHLIKLVLNSSNVYELDPVTQTQASTDLKPLAALKMLEKLVLNNIHLESIAVISHLTTLKSLTISATATTSLVALSALVNLTGIDVSSNPFISLQPLSTLIKLKKLLCSGTRVSDISVVSNFKNLSVLDLSRSLVSDIGPLSSLEQLEAVSISQTPVRNLGPLLSSKHLKALHVQQTQVAALDLVLFESVVGKEFHFWL
ncbi:hypothetical protein HDU98_003637 [Podochytrium sp. JEL0797]|nr:hypothetical protein HDU98_003637 [Podochytrium sp. JEL0797]